MEVNGLSSGAITRASLPSSCSRQAQRHLPFHTLPNPSSCSGRSRTDLLTLGVPAALVYAVFTSLKKGKHLRCHRILRRSVVEVQSSQTEGLLCRRGVLPNGLRYVLLRHLVPPGRFEAHLEIHAGSVDETDDQRGMAHMLEHVCFLGSERRVKLQSGGLGMTSNACTDFNHTVYHLSMDSEHLSKGLDALAEIGFAETFKAERVEKERAAVLSEAQMVNDVTYRLQTQFIGALHAENLIHERFPIGLPQQISRWTVDDLYQFHRRWYVPENSTLFIIGDIDEDVAVKEVERAFGAMKRGLTKVTDPWKPDVNSLFRPVMDGRQTILHEFVAGSHEDSSCVLALKAWSRDLKVTVVTNDLIQGMQIVWAKKAPLHVARTFDQLKDWLTTRLAVEAVRLRLQSRWRSGAIPCNLHSYDSHREGVAITTLTVITEPIRWQSTVEEVMQEILAIFTYTLGQEEFELAQRLFLDKVQEAARAQPWSLMGTLFGYDAAGTSREVADALIASSSCGHLFTTAPKFSDALQKASKEIFLDDVNRAVRLLLEHFGSTPSNNAGPRGTVVVSCPAAVSEEHTGRKVAFHKPDSKLVEDSLRNVPPLSEDEVSRRRISCPTSMSPAKAENAVAVHDVSLTPLTGSANSDVCTYRLSNGALVRLFVFPAAPSDGPARGALRITAPGGRATEVEGRRGTSEALMLTLNGSPVGEWSREEVQLFRCINSVSSEFRAGSDALEFDVFFAPTASSIRASMEWLHWLFKAPQLDLQGFSDAQLRMKGNAHAREKSILGRATQELLEGMYPNDPWLPEASLLDVNKLTLGQTKRAAEGTLTASNLEVDISICVAQREGSDSGLSHSEEIDGAVKAPSSGLEQAVEDMRKLVESEVIRCLGSLPLPSSPRPAAAGPCISIRGFERRIHVPDNEVRGLALIGGSSPGFYGRGDSTWETTSRFNGSSWGKRATGNPLYPSKAMELMIECLNIRLIGRVRDQLSLTYNAEVDLTMYEGFPGGHYICKVFSLPEKLEQAAVASMEVLRSPGWLPFTDQEIQAAKRVMAYRDGRARREEKGYWLDRLRSMTGVASANHAAEEAKLLASLGADDVQHAWSALGSLDDPFVVLATSGPSYVTSCLPSTAVVSRSTEPIAVTAAQAAAAAAHRPTSNNGGASLNMLD